MAAYCAYGVIISPEPIGIRAAIDWASWSCCIYKMLELVSQKEKVWESFYESSSLLLQKGIGFNGKFYN